MLAPGMVGNLLPKVVITSYGCAQAGVLLTRGFAEFPSSRTRSVDQAQQPGSSPARSPDAPADPEELMWNEGKHADDPKGKAEALRNASWKSSEVFRGNDIREPGAQMVASISAHQLYFACACGACYSNMSSACSRCLFVRAGSTRRMMDLLGSQIFSVALYSAITYVHLQVSLGQAHAAMRHQMLPKRVWERVHQRLLVV